MNERPNDKIPRIEQLQLKRKRLQLKRTAIDTAMLMMIMQTEAEIYELRLTKRMRLDECTI